MHDPKANRKGDRRRAALLRALDDSLRERALGELSINELSQAAGMKRSAFYFYFPSKQAAVAELLAEVFEEILRDSQEWLLGKGDPRETLAAALGGIVRHWHAHRHLLLAMLEARDTDPDTDRLWNEWLEQFTEPLAGAIQAERDAGRAPGTVAPATLARLLVGMDERALERNLRDGADPEQTQELVRALTSVSLAAIYGITE